MLRHVLLSALILSVPAVGTVAQTLNLDIRPANAPSTWVGCTLRLDPRWFTLSEVRGQGPLPRRPVRWPAGARDRGLFEAAIAALASGALPPTDPTGFRRPDPPNISVMWITGDGDALRSGLYIRHGLTLPPVLAALVSGVIPGSLCARAVESE